MRSKASDQIPLSVEDIDEAIAWACHVIVMGRVLQGKGDIELVIYALDAEGSETLGWWSCYRTIARQRRVGEGFDHRNPGLALLDPAGAEIGAEQEVARPPSRAGQAFVDAPHQPPLTHGFA